MVLELCTRVTMSVFPDDDSAAPGTLLPSAWMTPSLNYLIDWYPIFGDRFIM